MILFALVIGCAEPPTDGGQDPSVAEDALALIDPERALALLGELPGDAAGCTPELFADGAGLREVLSDCADGAMDGALERYSDDTLAWMEAEGLRVRDALGALTLRFDGAIERSVSESPTGWLTRVELAATLGGSDLCGSALCSDPEGAFLADLSWTLLGSADVSTDDVLVTGTLLLPGEGAIDVEGSWTRDEGRCVGEPLGGTLLLHGARSHTLRFDGASACDGCVAWSVDGEEPELVCGLGG